MVYLLIPLFPTRFAQSHSLFGWAAMDDDACLEITQLRWHGTGRAAKPVLPGQVDPKGSMSKIPGFHVSYNIRLLCCAPMFLTRINTK